MSFDVNKIREELKKYYPEQDIFLGVVNSFLNQIEDFIQDNKEFQNYGILRRMLEPDKIIDFRISWLNGEGKEELHRGYRVQFTNALGPYKGGLRFHPSVNRDILKFLAFEQSLKNSLTGLQLGAGKGGADFNPSNYNEKDVMRFCQAFASRFYSYSGENEDVPAGDIGVGEREIGYIFGFTKRLTGQFTGVYSGKNQHSGGSKLRPQATAYGCLYFLEEMLRDKKVDPKGKTINISGSGNVALYACEKAIEMGMKVQTLSDSDGMVYVKGGMNEEQLQYAMDLKFKRRGRISEFAEKYKFNYSEEQKPWSFACDIAMPCATQNELNEEDAVELAKNNCLAVVEGANMPCTHLAVQALYDRGVWYAPGKASNAGGVSVSAFEMAQNALGYSWSKEKLDNKLRSVMSEIYQKCIHYGGGGS